MSDVDISELTKSHLANLRRLVDGLEKADKVKEHFEVVHNSLSSSLESRDYSASSSKKKIRLNENVLAEKEKKSKRFDINWNLEHCERCMMSYWPSNCRVYIAPKFGISRKSSRLFTRYKLLSKQPSFKSFKEKLLKSVTHRSMRLIYECRRCKSRNLIVRELNHPEPKIVQLNRRRHHKKKDAITNTKKSSKNFIDLKPIISTGRTLVMNKIIAAAAKPAVNNINKNKSMFVPPTQQADSNKARDRKFKTLQAKLKHSESQQEMAKNEKKSSFGSLADFLEKLN